MRDEIIAAGRGMEHTINTVLEEATQQALADFSIEEQTALLTLLRRLQRNLEAKLN